MSQPLFTLERETHGHPFGAPMPGRTYRAALRALADPWPAVLLYGGWHQGKSTVAARVHLRLRHLRLALLDGGRDRLGRPLLRFAAADIFDALHAATRGRAGTAVRWAAQVTERQPEAFPTMLQVLFSELFVARPVMLVVDDLDQVLEPGPSGRLAVSAPFAPPLAALFDTFRRHRGSSRLVVTARAPFSLVHPSAGDLGAELVPIRLPDPAPDSALDADRDTLA